MESGWEEKKIQALFSELKSTDEQVAPRFATIWNRTQLAPRRIRAFNPAFVAATALLVCALISLAVWSRYTQRTQPTVAVVAPPSVVAAPPSVLPSVVAPPAPVAVSTSPGADEVRSSPTQQNIKRSRPIRLRAQQNTLLAGNQKLTREAKAITNWQSPTSSLLSSPSDEIFSSLPQLNQSASELKSFLPSRAN